MYTGSSKKRTARLLTAALGAAAGVLVFVLLYGTAVLDTGWDAWILNGYDETDIQQHYAGWLLFRNSHWTFPLGLADTIAAPDGTVISYTDSLPWVSIGLKALRGILPPTFQWFGWYVLVCFALQGAAGALLTGRRSGGRGWGLAFSTMGGALFACLPTLWERAFRHTALASQYIFLFALYLYLEYRDDLYSGRAKLPWGFAVLSFWAIGIHPYFLPLVCVCALLAAVDCARLRHAYRQAAGQMVLTVGSALAGGYLCGALGRVSVTERGGYGYYGMNLNAILNPASRGQYRWSRVLPVLPQQQGQYEAFNYLGLGVLALVAAALVLAAVRLLRRPRAAADWWRRNGPLLGACLFLTLFAASHEIYINNWHLSVPLPAALVDLCGIFRSSGRMFYLVGACMLLFGLYQLCSLPAKSMSVACIALAAVLTVQVWDLSAAAAQKHAMLARDVPIDTNQVMAYPEVDNLGMGHSQLLATEPLREDRIRQLAILAGREGLATNISIAVSGEYPAAQASREALAAQLLQGSYDPQAVYVTTDFDQYEAWQTVYAQDAAVRLFHAYSCYFLWPIPQGG